VGRETPGGVCVLLANPRWERRSLKFLELSGVVRVMADGTDEDGARAARMDEQVVWEPEERVAQFDHLFFLFLYCFVGGNHTLSFLHSAVLRAEGFLYDEVGTGFFCFLWCALHTP